MPRTLTAMFDTRAAAEATRDRLIQAGVDRSEIDLQDQGAYAGGETATPHKEGLMAGIRSMFGSHDDHHAYAEGMSRGHVLLTATVQDAETDTAIQVLEGSDAVDLDAREAEWRQSGWTGRAAYDEPASNATYQQPVGRTGEDETIQLAEERLVLGKREVERGGVRVRSYIVETPVSEQVTLREETVGIERRPVNRPLAAGDDAFRDRSIEMRETGEEVVVGKEAFVTEEIALRKDVGQRTEEVRDSVRHTEVEVEQVEGVGAQTSASVDPAKRY